jgi:hypothetical protein
MRPVHRGLAAVAAPALKEATGKPDQIIDAVMARSIQADLVRTHPLAVWVIARDKIDYPLVARLVTRQADAYVLLAETLAGHAHPTAAWLGALGAAAV